MYNQQQVPADRILYPLWQPGMNMNINFGALQVPPNMIQNMQYFAGAAAKMISERAATNALRTFVFNMMAENGWGNNAFMQVIMGIATAAANSRVPLNDQEIYKIIDAAVDHFTALIAQSNPGILNLVPQNVASRVVQYLNSIGIQIQPQQVQAPAYAQYAQPSQFGMGNTGGYNNAAASPNTGFITNQVPFQQVGAEPDRSCKYSTVDIKTEEKPVDRTAHQMGFNQDAFQQPTWNAPKSPIEQPITVTTNPPLRTNLLDINLVEGCPKIVSFKEISDDIVSENSSFFESPGYDLLYCQVKNLEYCTTITTRQYRTFAMLLEEMVKFISGDINKQEMLGVLHKTSTRINQFYKMLNNHLVAVLNNIVSISKVFVSIDDIVEDMDAILIKLESISKAGVINDIRTGLLNWLTENVSFRKQQIETGDDVKEFNGNYTISIKVNVIVCDKYSDDFDKFTKDQLDFLAEMRRTLIYIITQDDVLYEAQLKCVERNNTLIPYSVYRVTKAGQLL